MKLFNTNTLKSIGLVLLIALSLVFNQNSDFWQSVENTYLSIFFVLLFSVFFIILPNREIKLSRLDVLVVALLLLSAISRILRLGSLNEIKVLSSLGLVFYFLSVKTFNFKNNLSTIYNKGIVFVTFTLSVFSILEFYQLILPTNFNWRMAGNFSNPGPLGGFIAIVVPFVFSEMFKSDFKKPTTVFYVLIAFVMVFVLVLSNSRAALLSVVISILIWAGCYGSKKWKYFKYMPFLLIPIMFMFIKGLDSISGRFLIWKITLKSFFEKPIFGIGYDFFKTDYLNFQANYFSLGGTEKEVLLAGVNHHAFNEFIKFFVENGLLGVGLVAIGLVWILRTSKSEFLIYKNKNSKHLHSLLFFGAFITFSMFSYPLQFLPFKLILLNQLAFQNSFPVVYGIRMNKSLVATFIILSGLIFYLGFKQYEGIYAWKRGSELQFKNPQSASVFYEFAEKRLKYDGIFLFHYGLFEEKKDNIKALNLYRLASKTYNDPFLYFKIAQLCETFEQYDITETYLKKQHFMQPHLFKPQEYLLDFYIRRQDVSKAKCFANKILQTPIKVKNKEAFRIIQKANTLFVSL